MLRTDWRRERPKREPRRTRGRRWWTAEARFELTPVTPSLARIAVSAVKVAQRNAQKIQFPSTMFSLAANLRGRVPNGLSSGRAPYHCRRQTLRLAAEGGCIAMGVGFRAVTGGIKFIIGTPGVWPFAAVPVLLLAMLSCGLGGLGAWGSVSLSDWLLGTPEGRLGSGGRLR